MDGRGSAARYPLLITKTCRHTHFYDEFWRETTLFDFFRQSLYNPPMSKENLIVINPWMSTNQVKAGDILGVLHFFVSYLPSDVSKHVNFLHSQMLKMLLANKADTSIQDKLDGKTPLHISIENGHIDCAMALLDGGAYPNLPDVKGRTSLHYGKGTFIS